MVTRALVLIVILLGLLSGCGGTPTPSPLPATDTPIPTDTPLPPTASAPAWREFVSEEGAFAVLMPAEPVEQTQPASGEDPAEHHMVTARYGETTAFVVAYTDLPEETASVGPDEIEQILDLGRDGALRSLGGTLVREEQVTLDGFPGRHIEFELPPDPSLGAGEGVLRVYLVGARAYQVLALAARGQLVREDVDRFLVSFHLLERPTPTSSPQPSASPTPRATASPRPTASPSVATPPTPTGPPPTPFPKVTKRKAPILVDSEAGRLYLSAEVAGRRQIVALSTADGTPLAAYPADGPFALDTENGWLLVDRADEGLVVFDVDGGTVHAEIALPQTTLGGWTQPAPQVHPQTGQGLAFRDNAIYVLDLAQGEVLYTVLTSVRLYNSDVLPIAATVYDPEWAILYLIYTHSPAFRINMTLVLAFDLTLETEIGRQQLTQTDPGRLEAVARESALYGLSRHSVAGPSASASFWAFHEGMPRTLSAGWPGTMGPGLQLDAPRGRLYAATEEHLLVLDAETLALSFLTPRPAEGTVAGYDPGTDQLYFVPDDGTLQIRPASAIRAPASEPPTAAQPPSQPVRALTAAPSEDGGTALLGIWQAGASPDDAMVLGRTGGLPFLGRVGDDGLSWRQPRGGLLGEALRFTAVGISPAYEEDRTLLAGVLDLGVFRSTDGGRLWRPASAGLETMQVEGLLLSPGFAADGTSFAYDPYGPLHRSRDGARTWQALALEAYRVAMSPEFDQDGTLLAAGGNHPYGEMHLSRDGGQSWDRIGQVPNASPLTTLSLAPLFAQWQVAFAYEEEGQLYRSVDGGQHWSRVLDTGLSPSGAELVYVPGIEAGRPVFLLAAPRYNPTYNTATGYVPAEPPAPGGRLYRSLDGGLTWEPVALPPGIEPTALALSPTYERDHRLYLGTADGRVVVFDGSLGRVVGSRDGAGAQD